MNLTPTAQDMPDMAIALIRAIIAAADKDRDEMTVLLIYGERAAVIARPTGMNGARARRPGSALTRPRRRKHAWAHRRVGRKHLHEHRGIPAARPGTGVSSRFEAMAQIADSWS